MNFNIPPLIINNPLPSQSLPDYPSAGVGVINGCENVTNVTNTDYLRVNSFSAAILPNNGAILAIAAQQNDLLLQQPIVVDPTNTSYTDLELSRREASRVYLVTCNLDSSGVAASPVRSANVISYDNLKQNITIEVDADIYNSSNSQAIWVLNGDFGGKQFSVETKIAPNLFVVYPYNASYIQPTIPSSWNYVTFGNTNSIPSTSNIQSLPYIEINGLAVPAIRPQIATNYNVLNPSKYYVYVITEAPVNGVNQLFFFSFEIGSSFELFLWKQLTFDGENRNAKIQVDSHGNLHVVWESSRCQPGQICYGMIGPGSRNTMNQTFISAVDKQADLFRQVNNISSDDRSDKSKLTNYLTQSIVQILPPVAIDLREIIDEYGDRGAMWNTFIGGSGAVTINDNTNIIVSGNPLNDEFIAHCVLNHDENDVYFDGFFSQLSYQISFDVNLTSLSVTNLSNDDINTLYQAFKSNYSSVIGTPGYNFYGKNNNIFTLSNPDYFFGDLIPLTQSIKIENVYPASTDRLRHFMLAAVPEKVRFLATNAETLAQYAARINMTEIAASATYVAITEQLYYTGRYKLSLLLCTSANLAGSLQDQKFHTVRQFSDYLNFNTTSSINIAVHYAKLSREESAYIALAEGSYLDSNYAVSSDVYYDEYGILIANELVRFTGNIIVVADGVVQGAENFIPHFDAYYQSFDITLGSLPGGQYPTVETTDYDGSLYENLDVTIEFTNIVIGPHTIVADPYQTSLALADRNVNKMVIRSVYEENASMTIANETWNTSDIYSLTLGLNRSKIGLSAIPITFEGRCLSPSLSIDYCDRAHIAYQSNRFGNWQIYYTGTINTEMPFRFDTRITKTDSITVNPTIGIDQNGHRLIAWQDDRNDIFQIYAARSSNNINCISSRGLVQNIAEEGDYEYDPYDPYHIFGSDICNIVFEYTNNGNTDTFTFDLDFYTDNETTILEQSISTQNISNWLVNGQQMPYNGVQINTGETVTIQYKPSLEDNIFGIVYYLRISSVSSLEITNTLPYLYIYYCPAEIQQSKKCTIPCIYTNSTINPATVHFRISAYRDQGMTELVMSASTVLDQHKWVASLSGFPSTGLTVNSLETISVFYNPEVLPPDLFIAQNSTNINALLCGVTYWIKVESNISGTYNTLDTFAFECSCDGVTSDIYRIDTDSLTWECSGQGDYDTRITNTNGNAIFPRTASSQDGMIYIAWEDYRYHSETASQKEISPDIYYCVYDANEDIFYSSAQGYYDKRVTTYTDSTPTRYYKPIILIGSLQNPSIFFNSRNDVFRRSCSLYNAVISTTMIDEPLNTGVFNETVQLITSNDVLNCLKFDVFKDDIIDLYHQTENIPIAQVNKPIIRFDIIGPSGTYAVRFKNENESDWSDWLSILPELPDYPALNMYNLRGDGTFRTAFEAFFVEENHFIAKWGLSPSSGNKIVSCEILTQNGKTPVLTLNILAVYQELQYKVELFSDSAFTIPLPIYGGYPVVSTNQLTPITSSSSSSSSSISNAIVPNDVSSIDRAIETINTIYVRITFEDPVALQDMLNLQSIQKYNTLSYPGSIGTLTFNILQQGLSAVYGQPLTNISNGIYTGSFPIQTSDGVCNKDGLAVLIVNVPDLSSKVFTPDFTIDSLDPYNVNKPALGDFYGSYSLIPQEMPEDIISRDIQQLQSNTITLEEFKFKYNREQFCSYISLNCVNEQSPASDGFINDTMDQDLSPPIVNVPDAPIPNTNGNNAPQS